MSYSLSRRTTQSYAFINVVSTYQQSINVTRPFFQFDARAWKTTRRRTSACRAARGSHQLYV